MEQRFPDGDQYLEELAWVDDDPIVSRGLFDITRLAVEAIESVDHASVMLMVGGAMRTVAATGDVARAIDHIQIEADDGPSFVAFRRGDITRITSVAHEGRWAACRGACVGHGVMSVAAIPIRAEHGVIGVLNVYSVDHHAFGAQEIRLARAVTAQTEAILRTASAAWAARQLVDQLSAALTTRSVIEQAKGIIIASTGCSADEAFDVLSRQSQDQHSTLRTVAEELVARKAAPVRVRSRNVPSTSTLRV